MTQEDELSLNALQATLSKNERNLRIEFRTLTKKEKDILMKTVKLQEEVGELANEILASLALQRKSKLDAYKKQNMYEEFGDVVISTFSLANSMGVDLDRAVKSKIEKLLTVYTKDK